MGERFRGTVASGQTQAHRYSGPMCCSYPSETASPSLSVSVVVKPSTVSFSDHEGQKQKNKKNHKTKNKTKKDVKIQAATTTTKNSNQTKRHPTKSKSKSTSGVRPHRGSSSPRGRRRVALPGWRCSRDAARRWGRPGGEMWPVGVGRGAPVSYPVFLSHPAPQAGGS